MSRVIGTPVNQVRHTNVATVRMQKKGFRFEIACYRNKVLSWRNKAEVDLGEVLQIDTVFTNVSQGKLASKKDLLKAFNTSDPEIVIRELLDHGELQVSEQEREVRQESMFRDVAAIVVEKAVNPDNNRPYTLSMIQNAMKDIHYSVNTSKGAKSQALDVIRKLKEVMPIGRAKMRVRVSCPQRLYDSLYTALFEEAIIEDISAVAKSSADEKPSLVFTVTPSASADALFSSGSAEHSDAHASTENVEPYRIELLLAPEKYKPLQTLVQSMCGTAGFVEVLQLNSASADVVGGITTTGANDTVAGTVFSIPTTSLESGASNVASEKQECPAREATDVQAALAQRTLPLVKPQKVGKRAKRVEKEARAEREAEAAKLKERMKREQRIQEEKKRLILYSGEESHSDVSGEVAVIASAVTEAEDGLNAATAVDTKSCNTCGGAFSAAAYRVHFRSEWHRFNLKLKMRGETCVDETTFMAMSVEELSQMNT